MSKEAQMIKAFAANDLERITTLANEAQSLIKTGDEIQTFRNIILNEEFNESVEGLLTMDKELKSIEIYRVLLNTLASLRKSNRLIKSGVDKLDFSFEAASTAFNDIPRLLEPSNSRFVNNIRQIQALMEREIEIFVTEGLLFVKHIPKKIMNTDNAE
jgi:hypothetical protein